MLLEAAGFPVQVVEIDCEEKYPASIPLSQVAEYVAQLKADAARHFRRDGSIVITADTVVVLQDQVLEKPQNKKDAVAMLQSLSGQCHQVFTGVVISSSIKEFAFTDESVVTIAKLTDEEINYYIEQYSPFDKAGSYGIQDWIGWTKVRKIEGSYANVMGLPVDRIYEKLKVS